MIPDFLISVKIRRTKISRAAKQNVNYPGFRPNRVSKRQGYPNRRTNARRFASPSRIITPPPLELPLLAQTTPPEYPTYTNASTTSIMVKFYESSYSYDYSFPAVTLAYFLRYPNPYSTHVLSTDVISRTIDAAGRLQTTRIHRKSSKLPSAVLKLLPQSVLGSVSGGKSESFILETSTIDVKEGWMRTESKNLDWTGILSVVEKQEYKRLNPVDAGDDFKEVRAGTTDVVTTVMFRSRLGDRLRARATRKGEAPVVDGDDEPKKGFLANWSKTGIQRSIEAIASRKTENQLGKSKEGMMVVLERMRRGGLVGVLEGMRKDQKLVYTQSRS